MEQAPKWLTPPEMRAWTTLIDVTSGVMATLDTELRAAHGLIPGSNPRARPGSGPSPSTALCTIPTRGRQKCAVRRSGRSASVAHMH